jgi:hypothetical protein
LASNKKGSFKPGRPEKEFVRANDLLSPAEDFADSITTYIHKPTELEKMSQPIYDRMRIHFSSKLKAGPK